MNPNNLLYKIAISLMPGIGSVLARQLVAYTGGVDEMFTKSKKELRSIPELTPRQIELISDSELLVKAEKELKFIEKEGIELIFYLDDNFPTRLKNCPDAPVMLFKKGNCDLNHPKMISMVGTRNATHYGVDFTNTFIEELKEKNHDVIIVSGLAFGIDVAAHKAALNNGLKTVAVCGHGLNMVYPAAHKLISEEIMRQGAVITEFTSNLSVDRAFFVKRNRIIAGLSDATIVVESANKGGSLITADIANSYNRDVFALPGKIDSKYSVGCNKLIKSNKAALIEGVTDLEYILGWDTQSDTSPKQTELFIDLSKDEERVLNVLRKEGQLSIDNLMVATNFPMSKVSPMLLNLEFSGLVKCHPGKVYQAL